MEEKHSASANESLDRYATYEDYLDARITDTDRFYLEEDELARQLIEIGCHNVEVLSREEFQSVREAAEQAKRAKLQHAPTVLANAGLDLTTFPFLQQLAAREELVRSGKLFTIIFIRDRNSKGQEISGYIDYGVRLEMEDWTPYFERKKRLLPRPTDLSFCNWDTHFCTASDSRNFQLMQDTELGILFVNRIHGGLVNVDPNSDPGSDCKRYEITTEEYLQVVLYDHMTRTRT